MCPGAARAVPGGEDGVTQHRVGYWEWNQTGQVGHPHVIVCVHGLTRQGRDFDVLVNLNRPFRQNRDILHSRFQFFDLEIG